MHDERCDVIIEYWTILKDYIPNKDRAQAAEHVITTAMGQGFSKSDLMVLADGDNDLSEAYDLLNEDEFFEEDDAEEFEE